MPWWGRARLDIAAGDYRAAIKDLSEALTLRPERGDAWLLRGTAYRRDGAMQPAASDFGKAIELRPEAANVYLARASASFSWRTTRRHWLMSTPPSGGT